MRLMHYEGNIQKIIAQAKRLSSEENHLQLNERE